jgi:hypothetical protein
MVADANETISRLPVKAVPEPRLTEKRKGERRKSERRKLKSGLGGPDSFGALDVSNGFAAMSADLLRLDGRRSHLHVS